VKSLTPQPFAARLLTQPTANTLPVPALYISLVRPFSTVKHIGEEHTAGRWANILRQLGHKVHEQMHWSEEACDMMIAIHARKSASAIRAFRQTYPDKPLLLIMTGTDLYQDLPDDVEAQESLELADRLIVLQAEGMKALPEKYHAKTRIIYQSAVPLKPLKSSSYLFNILLVGHLRQEKDPFCLPRALHFLSDKSEIRVAHYGRALSREMALQAKVWQKEDSRYQWFGYKSPAFVRQKMRQADLLVHSSLLEGGANAICEAIQTDLPIIASAVPGNIGMLGADYPGFFPVQNPQALADKIRKALTDKIFYQALQQAVQARQSFCSPAREKAAIDNLLREFSTVY
jgi:putative glycosyltransferase (TIGR04348 family)